MFRSLRPRSRQALVLYAVAAALVLAGGATAAYFGFVKKPGNVSHPSVEFTQPVAAPKHKVVPETFKWPIYGYTPDRNRYLDANISPPFKRLWVWKAGSLGTGPTDAEEIVREVVESRRRQAHDPLDALMDDGKGLPPFKRHMAETWQELEDLANEPEEAGPEPGRQGAALASGHGQAAAPSANGG